VGDLRVARRFCVTLRCPPALGLGAFSFLGAIFHSANIDKLGIQVGQLVKLRPLPRRYWPGQGHLPPLDDSWWLDQTKRHPRKSVRLVNISTHHFVDLEGDNLQEFRSPHFLLLKCRLTLTPHNVLIEPLRDREPCERATLPAKK